MPRHVLGPYTFSLDFSFRPPHIYYENMHYHSDASFQSDLDAALTNLYETRAAKVSDPVGSYVVDFLQFVALHIPTTTTTTTTTTTRKSAEWGNVGTNTNQTTGAAQPQQAGGLRKRSSAGGAIAIFVAYVAFGMIFGVQRAGA